MIVFPMDRPVIQGIYAGYVDMPKFIHYYQNRVASGCIYYRASQLTGVFFFNREKMTNAVVNVPEGQLEGAPAIDRLAAAKSTDQDLLLDVYEIAETRQLYWASLSSAKAIYRNLSTDFTDLLKLVKKLTAEKLSGFVDVSLDGQMETDRIFLIEGKFIGCICPALGNSLMPSKEDLGELINRASKSHGIFNVYSMEGDVPATSIEGADPPPVLSLQQSVMTAMAELLSVAERLAARSQGAAVDFQTLLKKHFVANVEQYPFLDPFAAEFEYSSGKINFSGKALDKDLANGVFASVSGLVNELGLESDFIDELIPWQRRYALEMNNWGLVRSS